MAAQELALALARHGDWRVAVLELAGVGIPMGLALAVLVELALVLLDHVVLGHGGGRVGFGRRGGGGERKPNEPFCSGL